MVGKKYLRHWLILYQTMFLSFLIFITACSDLVRHSEVKEMGQNHKSAAGNSSDSSASLTSSDMPSADKVAKEIELCPPWSELKQGDDATRIQIMNCLEKIASYNPALIRQGMEKYVLITKLQNAYDVSAMSRLYVLNRYIFNVPEKAKFERAAFGGWLGVPYNSQKVNDLWPLTFDKNGKLSLTEQFRGYSGDDYQALQEFDYFNEKYGLRRKAGVKMDK